MLEYKKKHALIEICIYLVVFLIILLFLYLRSEYQSSKYKAKSSVLSVFFGQPFEVEFQKLVNTIVEFTYKKYTMMFKPILELLGGKDGHNGVFLELNNQFNVLKDIMAPMRTFFISNLNEVHETAEVYIKDIDNRNEKMNTLVNSIGTKYQRVQAKVDKHQRDFRKYIEDEVKNMPNTDYGNKTWDDPDFCFSGLTSVKLDNNKDMYFRDLGPGMRLEGGELIICHHKFKNTQPLFLYDNKFYLTGSHKVFEDNDWIKVKDSKKSYYTDFIPPFVYCITTGIGSFSIEGTMFKDFSESRNPFINKTINSLILTSKNSPFIDSTEWSHPCEYLEHGFDQDTNIETLEGKNVKIKNIQIGDKLAFGGEVIGKIELLPTMFKIYKYKGIIVSSNTKVWDNKIWKNIECVEDIEVYDEEPLKLFNIVTSNNTLSIGEAFFMDYLETTDPDVNKEIDKLIDITDCNNIVFMEEL